MMVLEIILGKGDNGNEIKWAPKNEKNPHFMVVGTSGSGKTETLKAIIHELSAGGVPSFIVDFHQDFDNVADNVLDFTNMTINPLEYAPETPEAAMYKVSNILKKIFVLGVQQEGVLQDAILSAYRDKGIDIKSMEKQDAPTFEDVKNVLENKAEYLKEEKRSSQTIETLLVRLRPLFNTGFFTSKKSAIPFKNIFAETTVLKLKNMPTEEVKYAIAEFFINKLKYELYARGKTDKMVLYCIVDEAHRLIDEKSPLNDLLRESRKYGTGVILSSQRPSDFSDTVLANVGGIIAFQCRLEKDAIFVGRQMGINFEEIKNLTEVGTGFVNLSSKNGNEKVKITPLWKRKGLKTVKKERKAEKPHETKQKEPAKKEEKEEDERSEETPAQERKKPIVLEEEDDAIYIRDEYRYFPPLLWFVRGMKAYFSSIKRGALFAVVMGFAYSFLEFRFAAAVTGVFLLSLMIAGFMRSRGKK
ncbi:MAG: ATP-binding protein [Candidatus Aenigmarchaeota archaeon]|nr:ATP-binding protein [Candidatus Aenigmarchaeota archaeon]